MARRASPDELKARRRDLKRPIQALVIRRRGFAVTDPEAVAKANEELLHLHETEVKKERRRKLKLLKQQYKIPERVADQKTGFKVIDNITTITVAFGSYIFPADIPILIGLGDAAKPLETMSREELIKFRNIGMAVLNRVFGGQEVKIGRNPKIGRPPEGHFERLEQLFHCFRRTKRKFPTETERAILRRIANHKDWWRPYRTEDLDSWINSLERRLRDARHFRKLVAKIKRDLLQVSKKVNNHQILSP